MPNLKYRPQSRKDPLRSRFMNKVLPLYAIPLLLPAMLLSSGCGTKDPEYQGKTVSAWVSALEDPDPQVKQTAADTLVSIINTDPNAIKTLIAGMKNGNYAAADMLGFIGKDAGPLTPDVVQGLADTIKKKGNLSTRLAACRALPKFGSATGPAVPALIEMLKDESPVIREMGAETLGKLPVDLAKQASSALLALAKNDSNLGVQQKALETLRIVDPEVLKKAGGA
jgi:HEAT repeat protein